MSATLAICVTSYYHRKLETMTTKQEPTLTILHEGTPIFTSHGKWLHPLFELEQYLADHAIEPAHLLLQDKIRLMLDSRVVDVRMVYTDDSPCPTSCQE